MPKNIKRTTLETAFIILQEGAHPGRAAFSPQMIRDAVATVEQLERLERALRRRAEYACNFPMTEAEQAASDRKDSKVAEKVAEILSERDMTAEIGGDARGPQIHLRTPNTGRSNTFGGAESGWAV